MTQYLLWAAWSQNERLAGRPGIDLPEPDEDWLIDVLALAIKQTEDSAKENT